MSWYKNVLIENVIEKYLASADQEVLATRNRLIEERLKVVEKSKNEPVATPPEHHHHHHRHVYRMEGANPLIEFLQSGDHINYHDLSFNEMVSDVGSSNEDEDELMEEEIHFLDEYEDEDYSEDEEEIEQIVLEED